MQFLGLVLFVAIFVGLKFLLQRAMNGLRARQEKERAEEETREAPKRKSGGKSR
jgi:hypothetical protein